VVHDEQRVFSLVLGHVDYYIVVVPTESALIAELIYVWDIIATSDVHNYVHDC
jgi:hypothetical protein